ncbi:hypothetical protein OUZ56_026268 [Daphnia magna]|uniref:Reverse transcriptase/retrotransposon-derived protein RNase H-like domain-containing protein n=1 Tax=Daphnia magna TaxID=35525 RepID=A0ABQ9ZLB9_9CRUS|nr:hypothetical protein OUZ56_026268 [Daphnia magna]
MLILHECSDKSSIWGTFDHTGQLMASDRTGLHSGASDRKCLTRRVDKLSPILSYPNFTREFIIYTDASGYGIGAVLAQIQPPPQSADSAATDEQDHSESDDLEVVGVYF